MSKPTAAERVRIERRQLELGVCKRIGVVATALTAGFSWVGFRLYELHVTRAAELTVEAAAMRKGSKTLHAPRGNIYDRQHNLLAYERQVHQIVADTQHLRDIKQVLPRLARAQKISKAELANKFTDEEIFAAYRSFLAERFAGRLGMTLAEMDRKLQRLTREDRLAPVLATDLETAVFRDWEKELDAPEVTGIFARSESKRVYPDTEHFVQLLGSINHEGKAVDGVEQMTDATLRGKDGAERLEKAAGGSFLPGFSDYARHSATPGSSVVLTVDLKLQQMLEQKLHGYFTQYKPKTLCSVLVEPRTGSVLAMASEPEYQPIAGGGVEHRNICVTDCFEPGSTMKIVTVAAALDTAAVSLGQTFYCHQGAYEIPDLGVWVEDDTPYETLSVANIFINSSNIGAYKIARQLGAERFFDYLKRFGYGQKTGLALPRQAAGIMPPLEKWTPMSLRSIAMGYENNASPLQVAMMGAAIANGGLLMKPKLVSHIEHADGRVEEVQPEPVRQSCSAATARKMTQIMEGVVNEGSGKLAAIEGVRVAGKTGTAQLRRRNAEGKMAYSSEHRAVWFVGFVPADKPQFACVVMAEDPQLEDKKLLYGGKFAAPIFADIATAALELLSTREKPPAITAGVSARP
jgi:cell division protein FtsI/penicillin-binding protein 2